MALNNYSTANLEVTVNGLLIDDWGNTDPPFTHEPIDQRSQLLRGQGGNAARLDAINPGRRVTINLQPGGTNSKDLQQLKESGANISLSYTQISTLESAIGTEGVIVNDGQVGRGGKTTLTDDQFIIEFNVWNDTKGGS